ncbi:MAG: hypothetical protein OXT74_14470 [Candidatus Poribacteria bacterium]|nr:hypothetical protein [Candidatus Poribacteria bacterium]
MKALMAACLLVAFCFAGLSYGSMPDDPEHRERFAFLKMIEYCDLVVKGKVTSIDYVVRQRVMPNGGGAFTTDVTIDVNQSLKGSPNAGKDTVKFMILGGRGGDPRTGRRLRLEVSNQPEFAVNEEVVVFLKKGDPKDRGSFAKNFPHGRYQLVAGTYGKRKIENGNVNILYGDVDNPLKLVELPVELAIKLGKASQKDKAGAVRLENVIKALALTESGDSVTLAAAIIDDLKRKAQRIIDAPPAPKQ